jgi:hypothetical protein
MESNSAEYAVITRYIPMEEDTGMNCLLRTWINWEDHYLEAKDYNYCK